MKASHTLPLLLALGLQQSLAHANTSPATAYDAEPATEVFPDPDAEASCPTDRIGASKGRGSSDAMAFVKAPSEAPAAFSENAGQAQHTAAPSAPRPKASNKVVDAPLTTWWNSSGSGLKVLFVGGASFSSAIAVFTDGEFTDPSVADREITVRRLDGSKVPGQWKVGSNRKMLILQVPPGRYHVAIGAGLHDRSDRAVAQAAEGGVLVQ